MKYNPESHHRRSTRLKGFDYSQPGAYFITICTVQHECIFGEINRNKMVLNEFGKIAETEWLKTPRLRDNVKLDEYIIMPNHMHGIIRITDVCVGAHCNVPLQQQRHCYQTEQFGKSTRNSIPTIIKLFKSTVTRQINQLRNTPGMPVWQRNYFDHVIRNEQELYRIRQYIRNNPVNWVCHLSHEHHGI
jgi:putative transposase